MNPNPNKAFNMSIRQAMLPKYKKPKYPNPNKAFNILRGVVRQVLLKDMKLGSEIERAMAALTKDGKLLYKDVKGKPKPVKPTNIEKITTLAKLLKPSLANILGVADSCARCGWPGSGVLWCTGSHSITVQDLLNLKRLYEVIAESE
jgi:hypothetical protein